MNSQKDPVALRITTLCATTLSTILNKCYSECQDKAIVLRYRDAERGYVEFLMLCSNADRCNSECHREFHYAEFHHAECPYTVS
jgi:hypothetical protein